MGWTPEAPAARGQTRDRWESLQALVDQATELAERRCHRARATSSTTSTAAPPSSTPRSPTASPWPPSTPPRASSGTRCSSAASRRAPCRSPTPRRPPQIEEERRLLYVGMTRARLDLARVLGAGPATRAVAPPASPRGSSTRCCPQARAASPTGAQEPQGRQLPRVRQAAGHRRREEARPVRATARRPTTRSCSSELRELAHRARPPRRACPAYVVFTDATLQLIAEHKPAVRPGAAAHQRHRPDQARPATATTVLDLVG